MKFSILADDLSATDIVARWYYDEWCRDSGSFELVRDKVLRSTNRNTAPLIVLAKENGKLIGAAELKVREMDIFPEYEFWLGGVYVHQTARGKGLASKLVSEVIMRAKDAGIKNLYLQTEELSGGLYVKHGFKHLHKVDSKGIQVTVMSVETGI